MVTINQGLNGEIRSLDEDNFRNNRALKTFNVQSASTNPPSTETEATEVVRNYFDEENSSVFLDNVLVANTDHYQVQLSLMDGCLSLMTIEPVDTRYSGVNTDMTIFDHDNLHLTIPNLMVGQDFYQAVLGYINGCFEIISATGQ